MNKWNRKYFDQHIHTSFSFDSDECIDNYIKKLEELGITNFVSTDHYDFRDERYHNDFVCDPDEIKEKIHELSKKYPSLSFETGIEIGYESTQVNKVKEFINKYDLDHINLSVHYIEGIDYIDYDSISSFGVESSMNKYFENIIDGINNIDNFDIVSHIDYAFAALKQGEPSRNIKEYEHYLIQIMEGIIKKNKILEINVKVQTKINDDNHLRYLLRLYKSLGGTLVCISSDAHKVNRYLELFDYYSKIIKEEGFDYLTLTYKHIQYKYDI